MMNRAADSFFETWSAVIEESRLKERAWISHLLDMGVKAAHRNDGWVDREKHLIALVYPFFYHSIAIGDLIAIGDPDEYFLARITGVVERRLCDPQWEYEITSEASDGYA